MVILMSGVKIVNDWKGSCREMAEDGFCHERRVKHSGQALAFKSLTQASLYGRFPGSLRVLVAFEMLSEFMIKKNRRWPRQRENWMKEMNEKRLRTLAIPTTDINKCVSYPFSSQVAGFNVGQ